MNFGLVGVGKFGKNYIRTLQQIPEAKLIATASKTGTNWEALPEELRQVPHHLTYGALLGNEDIDTIIIATHPDSHFEIAQQALRLGKNVICEKPCMFTPEQYREIVDILILKKGSVQFVTNYINLWHNWNYKVRTNFGAKFSLWKIVNAGNGPHREYSSLWDYGSHVFSIIFHYYPEFELNYITKTTLNNYYFSGKAHYSYIQGMFGSGAEERENSVSIKGTDEDFYWKDDRTGNPLKNMIEGVMEGKILSNIKLSLKISRTLTDCEFQTI